MFSAIEDELPADVIPLDKIEALPDLSDYDAAVSRLKFRHLAARATLDWGAFQGLRVHFDEDGFWDEFWSISPYIGQWRVHIPRHGFHLLVVTGMRAQEHFEANGISTRLVHKGFAPEMFSDLGGERAVEMVTYGAEYPSRLLARRRLKDAGVAVRRISAPITELGSHLNRYLAALVCTLDGRIKGGRLGQALHSRLPRAFVEVGPGPEPMLKLFESAASGCATFCDWTPDLDYLGFVDGENIIVFRDFDELVEKSRHYLAQPDELRRIGSNGAALALERHTWKHRAIELRQVLQNAI